MPTDRPTGAARVRHLFDASRAANRATLAAVGHRLPGAAAALIRCIERGRKVLACGNGGSAGDAQHFAAELVNRFERQRRALAAIALTTEGATLTGIANDRGYDRVFSRQIEALGGPGDALLAISTSGNSDNVVAAVATAQRAGMDIVALTGRDGGALATRLTDRDIELRAVSANTARIQEMHLLMIHCLCRLIEDHLLRWPHA